MKKKFRIEKDSIGNKKIENSCLWGAQTQRSLENFDIGREKIPNEIIVAIGYQKKAAALTNIQLGKLDSKIGKAIIAACDQIINSNLNNQFPLSVWQTGSGTQTNMNANEVISNYAIKKLKGKIGSKIPVHPNDHVNLSQSSNDTFPTVMHIASNQIIEKKLINSIKNIKKILSDKTKIYKDIIKVGRTHTQDATPITLGQVFSGYLEQIKNNEKRILEAKKELQFIVQGGTAVGTGINSPKNFDKHFCKNLSKITKSKYQPASNKFAGIAAHDSLVNLSSALNSLATSLFKISNDLRFLASGPRAGIGEITLPANEPGSSIMPGKINPTQCEALSMVCAHVIGLRSSVSFACTQGHFQLNVYNPVIIHNTLDAIQLLSDAIKSFDKNCLIGIKANLKRIKDFLNNSLMLVTPLTKIIGYDLASKVALNAYNKNISLKESCLEITSLSEGEFDKYTNPKNMV